MTTHLGGGAARILIAPDSFKESLSSPDVAAALAQGWSSVRPDDTCIVVPLADGGEGTVDALVAATGGTLETRRVEDPLGTPVDASFGLLGGDGPHTAVVEVAAATGLGLVESADRDAERASSFGTGQLIAAALDLGVERVIVGLGGSASTDGGAGMAQALGIEFLDRGGHGVGRGGQALSHLAKIDRSGRHPRLARCELVAACDVDAPLTGPRGAAAIFAPQKGADDAAVARLDANLSTLARVAATVGSSIDPTLAGSGAAGGIGFCVTALLGGALRPGFDLIAEAVGLDRLLHDAELAITGEGRLDAQTLTGKAPAGVLRRATAAGVPTVAVAGSIGEHDIGALQRAGFAAALSISSGPATLAESVERTRSNLIETAAAMAGVWNAAQLRG